MSPPGIRVSSTWPAPTRSWRRGLAGLLLASASASWASPPADGLVFRHQGFEQLSRGECGNGGQNLHVSRRGELKLINWFDLDRDGFPDLVINNDHSPYENSDSLIYFQHPVEGFRSLLPTISDEAGAFERITWLRAAEGRTRFLPSLGGGRSVVADLNGDGRPEIIFANFFHGSTHDHFPVFVYWGTAAGYSVAHRSEFASRTATAVAVADLDGNGLPDLVVANLGKEDDAVAAVAGPRRSTAPAVTTATAGSRIYWQREDGFAPDRVTELPTRYAVDVKIADLDADGRLDLVFLQGGDRPSVRVFRGGAAGLALDERTETSVSGRGFVDGIAGEVAVADLDGDQRPDLAVAAGGSELELLFNRGGKLEAWTRTRLPAPTPLSVVAEDLDRDGRVDLAVAGFSAGGREFRTDALLYRNTGDGFDAAAARRLPVLGATTVRAADVNGDGWIDLAFANSQDGDTFDVPSYLYWGGPDGFAAEHRTELTSFGAVSLALADLNGDRRVDLFIANRNSGRSYHGGPIDSFVYWGNRHRAVSGATLTKIPVSTAFSSSCGDIFDEGTAAIAFTEQQGVAVARLDAARHLAGIRRWALPSRGYTTSLADLDRDGRLDLVVGLIDGQGRNLAILRGAEGGFAAPEFFQPDLPVIGSAIADLDRDGRIEILLGGRGGWLVCPLDAGGRPALERARRIKSDFQIQRLTTADLNDDGWPEVVATHYRDMRDRRNNLDSAIYWNRQGRFSFEDRTPLPTFGGLWVSVADVFNQGKLDVVYSNYHGETTRTVGLFIYRPDDNGGYTAANRVVLPALSAAASMVADFDADGFADIAVLNHTGPTLQAGLQPKSGWHGVGSYLYWGSEHGFDPARRAVLPSHGPHKATNADPGDGLRRRPSETYTSPRLEQGVAAGDYVLAVTGSFRGRSSCVARIQAGDADEWTELPLVTGGEHERRFRFSPRAPVSRLRYQLELQTGGAGTGAIVTGIELRRS